MLGGDSRGAAAAGSARGMALAQGWHWGLEWGQLGELN